MTVFQWTENGASFEVNVKDCIEYLKSLSDNSVDFIVTDPPYFIGNLTNSWNQNIVQNSHIASLPLGMKFDKKQGSQFQEFMTKVNTEMFRVLKPGGFYVSFSSPRMYHHLVISLENANFEIRDQLIWAYNKSQTKAFRQNWIIDNDKKMTTEEKASLKDSLEHHRTPQLRPLFEPMCLAMKPIQNRFIDNFRTWGTGLMKIDESKPFPTTVFFYEKPIKDAYNTHPTVKPIELIENLIDLFCPMNGTILDPFLGSGTTAVASKNKQRSFKGCDKIEDYIDITLRRLGQEKNSNQ